MKQPLESIGSLQAEFIQEAQSAPKLFKDLAKVEHYIAESYKTRSFIELIQNADDAESTVFGVYGFDDGLIVANNGCPFTIDDVESLCRSGSSNKVRGGRTIGYRGIGFKSVVNLARRIYIFSGDFGFYFDKNTTKKLLPQIADVPLVRIPHTFDGDNDIKILEVVTKLQERHQYITFFVFLEINKRLAEEELAGFDRSSLLFLNNLRQVNLDFGNIQRTINIEPGTVPAQNVVKIREATSADEWEILRSPNDPKDIVAFKRQEDAIIPAQYEESVIHSFTPTIEFSGAYFKINGDYSTDPSRKNIDMDEFSRKSLRNAVSLVVDTVIEILEKKAIRKGFFSPFLNATGREGSKFRGLIFKTVSAELNKKTLSINGRNVAFSSIRLRPDWINYEDYEKLCHSELTCLSKEMVMLYPDLPLFLEQMGVKKLYLEETLKRVNETPPSPSGAGQLGVKLINQYRYDLSSERVEQIKELKIFPVKNKLVSAREIKSIDEVNKDFTEYVINNVDKHDLKPFFSKLNIPIESAISDSPPTDKERTNDTASGLQQAAAGAKPKSLFKAAPNIQKWRSAEKNAQEYFKALEGVVSVADVSNANMGYDLEVLLNNGRRLYIEVKSVSSFSEPIKITNNEYSSAHSYGSAYYLAIVINEEPFQVRLIPDPIRILSFEKQIERWSWFCDSYKVNLAEVEVLFLSQYQGGKNEDSY
jgi:hypothetical protein